MQPRLTHAKEQFIGESVRPSAGSFETAAMAGGEPGLPASITWRGEEYRLHEVQERWKTTSGCSHGSGEQYVRRHWFRVHTDRDLELTLYCDRQASRGRKKSPRWWLYTTSPMPTP